MSTQHSNSKDQAQAYFIRKPKVPYYNSRANKENIPSQENQSKVVNKHQRESMINKTSINQVFNRKQINNQMIQMISLKGDEDQELETHRRGSILNKEDFQQLNYQRRQPIQPSQLEQELIISKSLPTPKVLLPLIVRKNFQEHQLVLRKFKQEFEKCDCSQPLRSIKYFQVTQQLQEQDYEKLIEWIFDASNVFNQIMTNETVFLAVSIFDRFSSNASTKIDLQLIGGISLLLASKMVDIYSLEMSDLLINLLHELFTIHQILILEQKVTTFLNYKLQIRTTFNVFEEIYLNIYTEFVQVLPTEINKIHEVGINVLKLLLKKQTQIRQYSLIEQSLSCLTYSIILVLDQGIQDNRQVKQICIQRTLEQTNHYKLNINRLDQLMIQIQVWMEESDVYLKQSQKIMKY